MSLNIPWKISTRIVAIALTFALCGVPELAQASGAPQQQTQTPTPQNQTQTPAQSEQQIPTNPDSAMPNPAQPPLKPAESLPQAPSATQQQSTQQPASNAAGQVPQQAPAGAAAAEAGVTAGGAASRPAGSAIAPAKQHQTRSLLLKIGAIGGAAVALGAIIGLSRATGSKPPGAP